MHKVDFDIEETLRVTLDRIRSVAEPKKVILFGSAARGSMGPDSDIDLLIIVRSGIHRRRTAQEVYRRLVGVGCAIDVVVVTEDDVLAHAHNDGIVIGRAISEGRVVYAA
jgi:uncharacterized protein